MSKNIKEISLLAAEWWASKLKNPKFDNGDKSNNGMFAMAFAFLATEEISDKSMKNFILVLSSCIENKLQEHHQFTLDVDYGPCRMLSESADNAGISHENFPWKTTMWIDENHVSVSYGYSAPEVYLYSNKAHWKKLIDETNWYLGEIKAGLHYDWIPDEEARKRAIETSIINLETNIKEFKENMAATED